MNTLSGTAKPFVDIVVRVPDTPQTWTYLIQGKRVPFTSQRLTDENIGKIKRTNANYGHIINKWCDVLGLNPIYLIALIGAESGGLMEPPNSSSATGLCQITPICAADVFGSWSKYNSTPITAEARNYLNGRIPGFTNITKEPPKGSALRARLLNVLQNDAEFNIIVGAHYLRWLIQRYNGALNKAYAAYNMGPYGGAGARIYTMPQVDSTTMMPVLPAESKGYLIKILGRSGFMELIVKGLA